MVGTKFGKLEITKVTDKGAWVAKCECGKTAVFPRKRQQRLLDGRITSCGCDKRRKAFKFRIYPNAIQQEALAVQFGQARFVYNHFLTLKKKEFFENGRTLSLTEMQVMLKEMKRQENTLWLKDGHSQVLQFALRNLDTAYTNFFRMFREGTLPKQDGKSRKDGLPKGFPRYHRKRGRQSVTWPQGFEIEGSRIYLPKVGTVRVVFHRELEGEIKNVTVSKTKSGKYFVAIQCEMEKPPFKFNGKPPVGVDLGLRRFATLSRSLPDGRTVIGHPNFLRQDEKKLQRLQRQLSRRQPGSKGREKARLKVVRLHERIANKRRDMHHKASHAIVSNFRAIGLETLHIKGMLKNHHLAKSISDSGWAGFVDAIRYKAEWYGNYVERKDRWFPSSKLCHKCGYLNKELKLGQSFWICPDCGTHHDRDNNAADTLEPQLQELPPEWREGLLVQANGNADGESRLQDESPVALWEVGSPPGTTAAAT